MGGVSTGLSTSTKMETGEEFFRHFEKIFVDVDRQLSMTCRRRQALVDGLSTSTKRLVLLLDVDKCLSTSTSRRQVLVDVDTVDKSIEIETGVVALKVKPCKKPCSLWRSRKLFSKPSNSAYRICRINNFLKQQQKFNSAYAELYYCFSETTNQQFSTV